MAFPVDLVVNPNTKYLMRSVCSRDVVQPSLLGIIMLTGEIIRFCADFIIIKFVFFMLIES